MGAAVWAADARARMGMRWTGLGLAFGSLHGLLARGLLRSRGLLVKFGPRGVLRPAGVAAHSDGRPPRGHLVLMAALGGTGRGVTGRGGRTLADTVGALLCGVLRLGLRALSPRRFIT